jgi:hypothetical protein
MDNIEKDLCFTITSLLFQLAKLEELELAEEKLVMEN